MMRRAAYLLGVAASLSLTLASANVLAQDREADAERLFREGQKLLEERRYGEACPKFEQAYKKDAALGTLLNLAFCHKEQGATWYAWLEFREAELKATEQGRNDRRDFAKGQLPALEKSLAKLVIDNPKSVPLVEVLVDDRRIPDGEKPVPFAAEPGQRKLVFRAKGKKSATLLVDVKKSDKPMRVLVPDMEDAGPEPMPEASHGSSDGVESRASIPAARAETPSTQSSQKTLALGAFGVGAIGGLVMVVAGIMTLTNDCASLGDNSKCLKNDDGFAEKDRGDTTATIATIGGIVMLAGGAAGAVLWFTSPAEKTGSITVRPQIGVGYAGLNGQF